MIKTMTLPVEKNNLQKFLVYLEKMHFFVFFRVFDRLPKSLLDITNLCANSLTVDMLKLRNAKDF